MRAAKADVKKFRGVQDPNGARPLLSTWTLEMGGEMRQPAAMHALGVIIAIVQDGNPGKDGSHAKD